MISRLHSDESSSQWLSPADSSNKIDELQGGGKNSLTLRDISGFASRKIIQGFRAISVTEQKVDMFGNKVVVPTATLMLAGAVPSPQAMKSVVVGMCTMYHVLAVHRSQLLSVQPKQIKTVVAFLNSTWNMDKVKSAKAVWKTGGGKKNIAWTLTVMAALTLLLLRPLVDSVARESVATLGQVVL